MDIREISVTPNISIGGNSPPVLIAGPCVIEGEESSLRHAELIADIANRLGIPFIFKSSYDKANRTSVDSYRGPGLDDGLRILSKIKDNLGIPLLTDVHSVEEVLPVSQVVDVIQIPAFLCRQTDLLLAAGKTNKAVNVKKGQFLAPEDTQYIIQKIVSTGNHKILLTERGTSFGYHQLVVDFRGLVKMRELGYPVIFDATHSVQSPGGLSGKSGGERKYAPYLSWASAAVGVDGLFMETHENPDQGLSDAANMIPISQLESILKRFLSIIAV